jgi:hypothetical protein
MFQKTSRQHFPATLYKGVKVCKPTSTMRRLIPQGNRSIDTHVTPRCPIIAARFASGGNAFHEPSSCRKKKIDNTAPDRTVCTQAQRVRCGTVRRNWVTRTGIPGVGDSHFATIQCKDFSTDLTSFSSSRVVRMIQDCRWAHAPTIEGIRRNLPGTPRRPPRNGAQSLRREKRRGHSEFDQGLDCRSRRANRVPFLKHQGFDLLALFPRSRSRWLGAFQLSLSDIENWLSERCGRFHCQVGRIEWPVAVVQRLTLNNTGFHRRPIEYRTPLLRSLK